jgi:predicted nucleotidyltransferase
MPDSVLEPAEREFLQALGELGVRFLIVGVSAASLQGARVATEDVDLWLADLGDPRIGEAARRVGGIWVPGNFGMQPPTLGGKLGDRFDIVLTMSGLRDFETEYAGSKLVEIDGIHVRLLPLDRIIESKRAADRPKDRAALPALEAALAVAQEEGTSPPSSGSERSDGVGDTDV